MLDLGEAHSLAEIIEIAHEAENHFAGAQLWFRGQTRAEWPLVPAAHRRDAILESAFANHFRHRAPAMADSCPRHEDYASWLPLMQHYGLPTRLLDWTESLMAASFFAVQSKRETAFAAVWMLAPGLLNSRSIGEIIPFLTDNRIAPLLKGSFYYQTKPCSEHPVAVIAPRSEKRMTAQLGNYTIHSNRVPLETHIEIPQCLARVTIPNKSRNKIKSDLSVCGIRRSSIFPDLQNLAREISELKSIGPNGEDLELNNLLK